MIHSIFTTINHVVVYFFETHLYFFYVHINVVSRYTSFIWWRIVNPKYWWGPFNQFGYLIAGQLVCNEPSRTLFHRFGSLRTLKIGIFDWNRWENKCGLIHKARESLYLSNLSVTVEWHLPFGFDEMYLYLTRFTFVSSIPQCQLPAPLIHVTYVHLDIQLMFFFAQCKCRSHHNLHKLSILFYENHFHLRPYKLIINLALSGIFLWSSLSIMDWTFNLMVEMRQLIAPDWCRRVWPQLKSWHSMTMISLWSYA